MGFLLVGYVGDALNNTHPSPGKKPSGGYRIRSAGQQELERIQTAVDNGTEVFLPLFRPQPVSSATSTCEVVDDIEQVMIAQARRTAPWLKELRAYMENDMTANGGEYESATELIEKKIREPDAKKFALQVQESLHALNVKIVGGKWWTYCTFSDGCTAFWLARPVGLPTDNWSSYGLIDMSEFAGTISPAVNEQEDSIVAIELIAFLVSVFERSHLHL